MVLRLASEKLQNDDVTLRHSIPKTNLELSSSVAFFRTNCILNVIKDCNLGCDFIKCYFLHTLICRLEHFHRSRNILTLARRTLKSPWNKKALYLFFFIFVFVRNWLPRFSSYQANSHQAIRENNYGTLTAHGLWERWNWVMQNTASITCLNKSFDVLSIKHLEVVKFICLHFMVYAMALHHRPFQIPNNQN